MWSPLLTIHTAISAPLNELLTRLLARDVLIVTSRPGSVRDGAQRFLRRFLRWLAVTGRMHPG